MTRGQEIKRRAGELGIFSDRELERATERVGLKVPRASIAKAENGEASDSIYSRLEKALDWLEAGVPAMAWSIPPVGYCYYCLREGEEVPAMTIVGGTSCCEVHAKACGTVDG